MSSRYSGGVVRKNQLVPTTSSASGVWNLGEATQATKADIWPYSGIANPISQSLRFRNSASAFLSRTSVSPTNNKIFTWSGWVKVGMGTSGITGPHNLIDGVVDLDNESVIRLQGNVTFAIFTGGSYKANVDTSATLRDPSAWYHIVVAVDMTQATSTNGIKIYVNGVQQTLTVSTYIQNSATQINTSSVTQQIGKDTFSGSNRFADYYLTDVNFIDGQQLTPSSFGSTNAVTGVWQPIQYTGTYGNNGWHLEFKDTTVGQDTSGNNNDWTLNNISTTLGTTYDLMTDVPTQWASRDGTIVRGNYCTWNSLVTGSPTLTNGNLDITSSTASKCAAGTLAAAVGSTSKYYFEVNVTSSPSINGAIALWDVNSTFDAGNIPYAGTGTAYNLNGVASKYVNGTFTSIGTYASYTNGDIIGVAFDCGAGTVSYYKNNTLQVTITDSTNFSGKAFTPVVYTYNGNYSANFGQRPFTYTPPSGFKSLNTYNLPTPTIGGTSTTLANKYFDTTLYTGTGSNLTVTNAGGFQPDFVWVKNRATNSTNNLLEDSIRGPKNSWITNATLAELPRGLNAFTSTGFSFDDSGGGDGNVNGDPHVAWQWNAGGANTTNNSGTITSIVRANPTAGFSIVSYTGNGTAGATVGHGLGLAPNMLFVKQRTSASGALAWHTGYGSNQAQMLLSSNASIYNPGNGLYFNSTTPGSSVVTLGTSGNTNESGTSYIMYLWAAVAGYSAFGTFTGNGNTFGPFVYTGFRPRFILSKLSSGGNNPASWQIWDTSRETYNAQIRYLAPNTSDAESDSAPTYTALDTLSNGFKLRCDGIYGQNQNTGVYVWAAFAEHPFKNSLAR
jgi:hypothetical protein